MDLSQIPVEWLALLPAKWLAILTFVTGVMSGASVLAEQIKRYVGVVDPKSRLGKFLRVLDWVGRNSTPVLKAAEQAKLVADHQRTIKEQEAIVKLQSAIIRDSIRPGAPTLDDETDTGRDTPIAKRKP